jgi:NAD(P)-dependent dehydrogenase (short-subunit alcohol dehydrogenase family)/acyl carrier protein
MSLFEKRILTHLPQATYAAEAIGEALQAMQQSSHVGKIVVLPPDPSAHRRAPGEWRANATGAHVITGAFGGFGVEIARWLVDRGARHLVLLGRRGATDDRSRALLDELAERGVDVVVAHCDVADFDDVTSLFERVARDMPPVVGVMHAAMVLDDGVIANLDAERFARVLAPKVDGAVNLDRATRDMRLDYFVLFSSVTTLIGNYGQGNYVAANAFMEGLARARRQRGLPALAVGWGAISDVGVAVSNETAQRNLRKLTRQLGKEGGEAMDVFGLRAREGLDLMARAMVEAEGSDDFAVITISRNDGGFRKDLLPVLRSPTFDGYVDGGEDGRDATEGLDLLALLRSEEIDVVRRRVTDVVVAQLAKVLHARPEELSRSRPLGEIGLDSLMTLELAMDIEKAVGASMSRMQSVGALTIQGLVDEIIAQAEGTSDLDDEPVEAGVSR